jgi:hypothetical protein
MGGVTLLAMPTYFFALRSLGFAVQQPGTSTGNSPFSHLWRAASAVLMNAATKNLSKSCTRGSRRCWIVMQLFSLKSLAFERRWEQDKVDQQTREIGDEA